MKKTAEGIPRVFAQMIATMAEAKLPKSGKEKQNRKYQVKYNSGEI